MNLVNIKHFQLKALGQAINLLLGADYTIDIYMSKKSTNIFLVTYLPTILMNIINQAVVYLVSGSSQDLIITVNITCMMVLTSVYLSVSSSLPLTPNIKPVEIWLLFNLFYPFFVIITNVVMQVKREYMFLKTSLIIIIVKP